MYRAHEPDTPRNVTMAMEIDRGSICLFRYEGSKEESVTKLLGIYSVSRGIERTESCIGNHAEQTTRRRQTLHRQPQT